MPTISAFIITKNEASDIADCLASIDFVGEIVVLDAGSSDATCAICVGNPKVKLFSVDWPGFGKQKNRALALTTGDFVLAIDADERVTPELQQEILQILNSNSNVLAYGIPRQSFFLGRAIRYCWRPAKDAPLRLFKKNAAYFSDDMVHEKLLVNGKTGKLQHHLLHYTFRTLEEVIAKMDQYSTLGVARLKQKEVKPSMWSALWHATWIFVRVYFLRLGFLDGWAGFLIAFSNFEGTFYRYAKFTQENSKVLGRHPKQT